MYIHVNLEKSSPKYIFTDMFLELVHGYRLDILYTETLKIGIFLKLQMYIVLVYNETTHNDINGLLEMN